TRSGGSVWVRLPPRAPQTSEFVSTKFTSRFFRRSGSVTSGSLHVWRRRPDSNRGVGVLQTPALPLGYAAAAVHTLERETGLEPATFSLARRRSTTELLPLTHHCYSTRVLGFAEEEEPDQQDHHHPPDPVHDPVLPSPPPVAKTHERPRSGATLEMRLHHPYNTVAIRHLLQPAPVAQLPEGGFGREKVTGSIQVVGPI